MTIIENLLSVIPQITANTSSITIFALIVPIILLFGARNFVNASSGALLFFGVLGLSSLAFSAFVLTSL